MKIAVLMSGQARYIERSAEWWKQRCFKPSMNLHVDYFFNLWDDGTDNLDDRVKNLYDAKVVDISDWEELGRNHIEQIRNGNENANDWWLVPEYVQHTMCYTTDEVSRYTWNFPGMFISTAKMAETFEPHFWQYDIVIKTRTDTILNDMSPHNWHSLFNNMLRNPVFNDNIFTPWLRIRNGLPFFGDLAFIGKPDLMQRFMTNMDKNLVKLATHDKHLLSDYLIDPEIPFAHWLWSRLSMYSRTDWLAISVVWPVPFGACLLRSDENVVGQTFQYLEHTYKRHEEEKHDVIFHKVGDTKN
tara:strand:- start:248 stop:1147 length:900 start_codon:yes stop_codon:yes gene_type:complete